MFLSDVQPVQAVKHVYEPEKLNCDIDETLKRNFDETENLNELRKSLYGYWKRNRLN